MSPASSALITVDLTDQERDVLRCGLLEWGGPARCTEPLATAMGFESVADLLGQGKRLRAALHAHEPLAAQDWRRTVLATEIVFVSDVLGSGWDWSVTTGFPDDETIKLLRSLQRKVARSLRRAD